MEDRTFANQRRILGCGVMGRPARVKVTVKVAVYLHQASSQKKYSNNPTVDRNMKKFERH